MNCVNIWPSAAVKENAWTCVRGVSDGHMKVCEVGSDGFMKVCGG